MNTIHQTMWLFFTVIILAFSAWYYGNLQTMTRLDNETLSSTVDTTITRLTLRQYDSAGLLANTLTTPQMQHIPKDDIHLFQTPHIIIAQKDQPAWEISSKKAKSFKNGQEIIFMKKVVVHQKPGGTTQESTLKTEKVIYYPEIKKATTDLFVTFEQPGNIIESTGMNAYLDEKRVELLHQARGSYAPSKG
jgi:lipopolysaccharide export system protein LptC